MIRPRAPGALGIITGVRLVRGPKLPPLLGTTLVLEPAAPALAGNTYLVVFRAYDSVAIALALATLLMAAVQLAFIPAYRRAWFNPGLWSFAFSYATACTVVIALRHGEFLPHRPPSADQSLRPGTPRNSRTMLVRYGRRRYRISRSPSRGAVTMRTHQPDEGVFRSVLAEDIDWQPFPAFPPSARLAVVVCHPLEPGPYVVRVKLPSGVKLMPHWHHEDRVISLEYVNPSDDPQNK